MTMRWLGCLFVVVPVLVGARSAAPKPAPAAVNAIARAVVFPWADMAAPDYHAGLPVEVVHGVERYNRCSDTFRPTIAPPERDAVSQEVHAKYVALERATSCLFDRPDIANVASEFAPTIALSYEWEGWADGPLGEAVSLDRYIAQHPDSPIRAYALLLAGHRKLCAVSGLEGLDPKSADGLGVAAAAEKELREASRSSEPLIRLTADYLLEKRSCDFEWP